MSKARQLADLGNVYDDGALSNRNLIINGAAILDQRNSGSSVTPSNGDYVVDRWRQLLSAASKYSVQQVTDAPTGFKNSIKLTSSSAYTVPSDEVFGFEQRIEGNNIVQLSWGTSSAKSASLSFWVKSSLTGVLSGVVTNNSTSFPFDYTINAANTWEYKTVIIDGDTSGTWATGSSVGLYLRMMVGLNNSGQWAAASGSWSGTNEFGSTSHNTNIVGTNGATWQITGVQLEVGDTATPFEHRSFGDELARCQRYYQFYGRDFKGSTGVNFALAGRAGSGLVTAVLPLSRPLRSAPTVTAPADNTIIVRDGSGTDLNADYSSYAGLTPTSVLVNISTTLTPNSNSACAIYTDTSRGFEFDAEL